MNKKITIPKVSILITAYNSGRFILDAINSVLTQTYSDWEIVLINDGSTDDTEKIIDKVINSDNRIRYFRNGKNMGFISSLNKGLKLSRGELIARLDSDDIWLDRRKLEKQVNYLSKHVDAVLIGTWGHRIDQVSKKIANIKYPSSDKDIRNYIMIENCFLHSSVVFRKDLILRVGGYDEEFKSAEDYALWLKIGKSGKMHNLPDYMVGYRMNNSGISMTRYDEQIRNTIKAVHRYGSEYPHSFIGLPLWYVRKVIPRDLRENISSRFRNNMS